jgi:uncharacterized membrane protein YdbT with pleckstrin-like domain
MSEPSQEQTLFRGSSSAIINLGTFLLCGLIAIVAGLAAFLVEVPHPAISILLGVVGIAALGYMFVRWLLIKVRVYEVTTERLRITNGIITRRTDELELYRVKDTTLVEPLFMRVFSLGHIDFVTYDATTPNVRLEAIRGARDLRESLRKAIETCREKKRVRLAEFE